MCWTLWTTRNKFTIEHVFPAKPLDFLFKTCIFLQQWRLLIKEEDRDAFDMMISKIRASAISLSPVQADSYDLLALMLLPLVSPACVPCTGLGAMYVLLLPVRSG